MEAVGSEEGAAVGTGGTDVPGGAGPAGSTLSPAGGPQQLVVAEVDAVIEERMRKKAVAGMQGRRRFVIYSDEGAHLGGDDSAPTPLTIFASGVAF